ncbi:MAG TPA: capsule biosynthesis protein, partial [Sulfitobacter sp.]|nr:capsule biosynthesis protein [Sulfitobacter sp.]
KKRHDRALAVAAREKKRETASQATILTLPVTSIVPPVPQARLHLRHRLSFVSFIIIVLGTSLFVSWYLWERAADRYTSIAGFAVHSEDMSSPVELLGGVANLSGSGAADEEVLYQFIQS